MIRIKNILVPTDLSDYAAYALNYGREFASAYGARLHLLHVLDYYWATPATADFPGLPGNIVLKYEKEKQDQLSALVNEIEGIDVLDAIKRGVPHVAIVRYARHHDIDLIILASHGRTGISHALIGSVAEKVVQMAPCPVLTIKHPEHEFTLP